MSVDPLVQAILQQMKQRTVLLSPALVGEGGSEQSNRKLIFVQKYLICSLVDVKLSSPVRVSAKAIVAYVYFSFILPFEFGCLLQ